MTTLDQLGRDPPSLRRPRAAPRVALACLGGLVERVDGNAVRALLDAEVAVSVEALAVAGQPEVRPVRLVGLTVVLDAHPQGLQL